MKKYFLLLAFLTLPAIAAVVEKGLSTDDQGVVTAANFKATQINRFAAYGTGTAYTLTTTPAAVTFGTTSPSITITNAGTYFIQAGAAIDWVGATFAANQTVTVKLRRTNNTAADLTSGVSAATTPIITTLTETWGPVDPPGVFYTTANSTDIVTLFADVSVLPSAGSATVSRAWIVAQQVK